MRPAVSVIVPVYNVEDVIVRCLDSLCGQSLKNIEIILIDDASPDRSGKICEKYAERDSRFKVLHHNVNRGLAVARNTGISYATADFLMFVDSDDWVSNNFCKDAYECAMHYRADIVKFRYQKVGKNGLVLPEHSKIIMESGYRTRLEALSTDRNIVWNKLYKKDLFDNISYPEGYYFEDIGTTYKTILLATNVFFLNKILYYYCYHDNSITVLKSEKHLRDFYEMSMSQYSNLKSWGYPAEKLDMMMSKVAITYCIQKKADFTDPYYVKLSNYLQSMTKIPDIFTWKQKVLFVLFRYSRTLFEEVCCLFKKKVC